MVVDFSVVLLYCLRLILVAVIVLTNCLMLHSVVLALYTDTESCNKTDAKAHFTPRNDKSCV